MYDSIKPVLLVGTLEGNFLASFMLGWAVTTGAGIASYPLDTIRRRMMMTSGEAVKYKGSMDAARQIMAAEGIRSFFKGAGANILRGVAGAGVLSIYDRKFRFDLHCLLQTANNDHRGTASHVRQEVQGRIRLNESHFFDHERRHIWSQRWRCCGLQLARLHWCGNTMLENNEEAAPNTRGIANRQQGKVLRMLAWASCVLSEWDSRFVPIVSYWFRHELQGRLDGSMHEFSNPFYQELFYASTIFVIPLF
jgi:hypothetical protein